MDYEIINVGQLSSHLESNKIDVVVDTTSSLIFGSTFFPGNTGNYTSPPPSIWAGPHE